MSFFRFLHVILAVTFSGVFLANYFYVYQSMREKNNELLAFTLKRSLFSDCIFSFPAIMVTLITGSYLVFFSSFSLKTPWIISAYVFLALVFVCWLMLFFLKGYNYVKIDLQYRFIFKGKEFFHILNVLSLLLLVIIIHDAVRKMTFIPWQILIR
jgi:Predicted integral membrane protein (DUF2269)